MTDNSTPWYHEGLRFKCNRCGACCSGAPGFVWVKPDEIRRIADHLDIPRHKLLRRYCRKVMGRISLMEFGNGDCVFLTPEGCRIYEVRPVQCRTFPFWPHILDSPEEWEKLKNKCPGVGHGRVHTRQEIERNMQRLDN
ncbi:MAG: YkgJ family cysteine cluster protein [Planctomycetota bacterium]